MREIITAVIKVIIVVTIIVGICWIQYPLIKRDLKLIINRK